MPYTFTCLHCGKTVTTPYANRSFCSRSCFHAHKRVQKTCVICGSPFEVGAYHADEIVTCRSQECKKAIYHKRAVGRNLSEAAKARIGKANSKPRIEVDCTCGCGEKVSIPGWRQRKNKTNVFFVDQAHMFTWLQGENHWNYRGGNVYYGDGWNKVAQSVRERDKVCQECGKTPEGNGRGLDVHHIIPVRISRDNSMSNLVALCISCHQKHQVLEQSKYPIKVNKYRRCLVCDKIFIPQAFQKFCSDECKRKRVRQWEKTYLDSHPEAYQARRQRIKRWQQVNNDRVNELHQQSRLRRKNAQ